jgi:hypothetical protein
VQGIPQPKACVPSSRSNTGDTTFNVFVQAIGPERTIIVDGHAWTVCEAMDPVTQTPTLIFRGHTVARRVRQYDAKWRDLSDGELYALSWSR